MRTRVQAVTQSDFEAWAAAQVEPTALPEEGTPADDGYQVFLSKGCTQCHTVRFDDDTASNIIAAEAFNGPELTHFASRNVFAGATLPEDGETRDVALRRWLADPPFVKPGSFMPNLGLTAQEIDALVAFLEGTE
jgi:cytochrome c oxidase subunit 2